MGVKKSFCANTSVSNLSLSKSIDTVNSFQYNRKRLLSCNNYRFVILRRGRSPKPKNPQPKGDTNGFSRLLRRLRMTQHYKGTAAILSQLGKENKPSRWDDLFSACKKTDSFVRHRRGGDSPPAQQLRSNCCSFRRKQKTIAAHDAILSPKLPDDQWSPLQRITPVFPYIDTSSTC